MQQEGDEDEEVGEDSTLLRKPYTAQNAEDRRTVIASKYYAKPLHKLNVGLVIIGIFICIRSVGRNESI